MAMQEMDFYAAAAATNRCVCVCDKSNESKRDQNDR